MGQPLEKLVIAKPFVLRTFDPPVTEIEGTIVRGVRRMGKRIVLAMDGERFIVIHLMIAGRLQWRTVGAKLPPKGSILATFHFPNGVLVLTEAGTTRRASMHLVRGEAGLAEFDRGGLEVLDATLAEFSARLTEREPHAQARARRSATVQRHRQRVLGRDSASRAAVAGDADVAADRDEEIERLFEATRATLAEWTARLRAEAGGNFPEKVTAFHDGDGRARPIRRAVSGVWNDGAADSLCVERDELLRAMPDGREAARGPRAVAIAWKGLAEVDRRHRVRG